MKINLKQFSDIELFAICAYKMVELHESKYDEDIRQEYLDIWNELVSRGLDYKDWNAWANRGGLSSIGLEVDNHEISVQDTGRLLRSTGQELRSGKYVECSPDTPGAFKVLVGKGSEVVKTIEIKPHETTYQISKKDLEKLKKPKMQKRLL